MFEILVLFWYCFDDRLAEALNYPALGLIPTSIWWGVFLIWLVFALFNAGMKAAGKN